MSSNDLQQEVMYQGLIGRAKELWEGAIAPTVEKHKTIFQNADSKLEISFNESRQITEIKYFPLNPETFSYSLEANGEISGSPKGEYIYDFEDGWIFENEVPSRNVCNPMLGNEGGFDLDLFVHRKLDYLIR